MHELSLAQSLLKITLDHARRNDASRVNRLVLSSGVLSCVEPTALETAFAVLSRGTEAEGAVLSFEIIPAIISCLSCEKEYSLDRRGEAICPGCGGASVLLMGGTEDLTLVSLELEQED